MKIPTGLTGVSGKRLLQGACLGAILTVAIGFSWFGGYGFGWYTSGGAETLAKSRELVIAMATYPRLCAQDFNAQPDAAVLRVKLAKTESTYARRELLPKEWLKLPGQYANDELTDRCAALVAPQKAAELTK